MTRLLIALTLLLAAWSPSPAALAQSGSEPVPSDYERLAERHGLQGEFPNGVSTPRPERDVRVRSFTAPNVGLSNMLILALFIAILAAAAYYVAQNARAYQRSNRKFALEKAASEEVEVWGMVPEDGWDALLSRLRLSTDFNVALHEMLLAAIGYCQKELSIHIPRANTPREIQISLPESFDAASDFETLVLGAEWAWFGAKPVDRDMFHRGLDALSRILQTR